MTTSVFYTRKLPHWQPSEETFFITYRLSGSSISVIETLKEVYFKERQHPDNQNIESKELIRQKYFFAFENELEKIEMNLIG